MGETAIILKSLRIWDYSLFLDPKMTDQSDRRASQVSESSKHSEAQKETEELSSPVKPVRVAPPPPPSVKQFTAPEEAPLESEFGDPSQFYQGYGGGNKF